jgi:hypothetical protein
MGTFLYSWIILKLHFIANQASSRLMTILSFSRTADNRSCSSNFLQRFNFLQHLTPHILTYEYLGSIKLYTENRMRELGQLSWYSQGYGLEGQGIGDQFPAGAKKCSLLPSIQTGFGTHTASYPIVF